MVGVLRKGLAGLSLAVALGLLGGSLGACGESSEAYRGGVAEKVACQEDEACWDWRTMGNKERGICVDGKNVLEHADGSTRPGGRGCQAKPMVERCVESALVVTRIIPIPVGWKFLCPEGRSMPNGLSDPATKTIKIGDSAGDGDDVRLRHVIAHELCHAVLWTAGDKSQGNPAMIAQAESNADRCAAERGF